MSPLQEWLETRLETFKNDIWKNPSVDRVTGLLLSVLAALIVWLTIQYSPGAAQRAQQLASSATDLTEAVINPFWGKITVAVVIFASLVAAFEPHIARALARWWRRSGKRWWKSCPQSIRVTVLVPAAIVVVPSKLASCLWSTIDHILVRVIAPLVGATRRGWFKRYRHLFGAMFLVCSLPIAAEFGAVPPKFAIPAVIVGLVIVLAIVRRWSWVESDRDTFLIERGERTEGHGNLRIGFAEDLRDEALLALCFIPLLVPLGLDLVQQTSTASGAPAFRFAGSPEMPAEPFARYITWLGFFGVELAKTVPFVDWSEVFNVANGSPIKPTSTLGSQLAFALRAGLDLLFLATVLQAVQIASRLRDQARAFENNRLPILEPFYERLELERLFEDVDDDVNLRPSLQPVVLSFPNYDRGRLKELISDPAEAKTAKVRKVAAALLQRVYESEPNSGVDIAQFWSKLVQIEADAEYRDWILKVTSGFNLDESDRLKIEPRRLRLLRTAKADWIDARLRAQAIRALGRSKLSTAEQESLQDLLANDKEILAQAAAAVALAKANVLDASTSIYALAHKMPNDAILPAQSVAFALAHYNIGADELANQFVPELRAYVLSASMIERRPSAFDSAIVLERLKSYCQTIAIVPGTKFFGTSFQMGSKDDPQWSDREKPERTVRMETAFALGRFAVTNREYRAFLHATGQGSQCLHLQDDLPATEVNWFEALGFCQWLMEITGDAWRLPTEAEWEYACRASSSHAYSWGPNWDPSKAASSEDGANRPKVVGSYDPNAWGLWDMHGNVMEWCADPWHENYSGTAPHDSRAWLHDGNFSLRVIRGGSWYNLPPVLRSAYRSRAEPTFRANDIGFRVVRLL